MEEVEVGRWNRWENEGLIMTLSPGSLNSSLSFSLNYFLWVLMRWRRHVGEVEAGMWNR